MSFYTFSDEQRDELGKLLEPSHVEKNPKGFDYLPGWFVEQEANRIFGYDGWHVEVVALKENCAPSQNRKDNWVVSFRCQVRLTVSGIIREGIGYGSGISADLHTAYEGAFKEAATDAEKRAFKTFGNPFGLALYDKRKENVGVNIDWPVERDDLIRLLVQIKDRPSLVELCKTPRMTGFINEAPDEFRLPVRKKIEELDEKYPSQNKGKKS